MYKTLFITLLVLFSLEACQYYSHTKQKYQSFPQPYGRATPKAKVVIDVGGDSAKSSFYKIDTSAAPFTIIVKERDMKNDSLITLVKKLITVVEQNTNQTQPQITNELSTESDFRFVLYILGIILTFASRFISPQNIERAKLLAPQIAQLIVTASRFYKQTDKPKDKPKHKSDNHGEV